MDIKVNRGVLRFVKMNHITEKESSLEMAVHKTEMVSDS